MNTHNELEMGIDYYICGCGDLSLYSSPCDICRENKINIILSDVGNFEKNEVLELNDIFI